MYIFFAVLEPCVEYCSQEFFLIFWYCSFCKNRGQICKKLSWKLICSSCIRLRWKVAYVTSPKKPVSLALYVSNIKNGEKKAIVSSKDSNSCDISPSKVSRQKCQTWKLVEKRSNRVSLSLNLVYSTKLDHDGQMSMWYATCQSLLLLWSNKGWSKTVKLSSVRLPPSLLHRNNGDSWLVSISMEHKHTYTGKNMPTML